MRKREWKLMARGLQRWVGGRKESVWRAINGKKSRIASGRSSG